MIIIIIIYYNDDDGEDNDNYSFLYYLFVAQRLVGGWVGPSPGGYSGFPVTVIIQGFFGVWNFWFFEFFGGGVGKLYIFFLVAWYK